MIFFNNLLKLIGQILIVIIFIFFSTLHAKNSNKFNKADNIANYFSGVILLNQSQYEDSYRYFKKLNGLEESHLTYASKYLYTLVNSGNFNQAFNFSRKIEREGQESFESEIIKGIFYFKNSNYQESRKFFLKAKNREPRTVLENYIANSLYFWSGLNDYNLQEAKLILGKFDTRLESLKKIQEVFPS